MQELKPLKKQKIPLADYDYLIDIKNRLILKQLSPKGIALLEEILFGPVVISFSNLKDSLDFDETELSHHLELLAPLQLFTLENSHLHINKEKRKYFELHVEKFDESFKPGMNYLELLLKRVPIQFLPNWYQISRSSNNIFNSIVERFLLTPSIYQRHIKEYLALDEVCAEIASDIHYSSEHSLKGEYLRKKYNLTEDEYQEIVLELEFQFMCIQTYKPTDTGYEDELSLISEWAEYLNITKNSNPQALEGPVEKYRSSEFSFIEDMSTLLANALTKPLRIEFDQKNDRWIPIPESLQAATLTLSLPSNNLNYVARLINKLLILGLAIINDVVLTPTPLSNDWREFPIKKRAHITFKHPHNAPSTEILGEVFHPHDRRILEIQKHVAKAATHGWVTFSSFLSGAQIPFSDTKRVYLKQVGKNWKYALPDYTEEECRFIHSIVFDWLYESGVVQIGNYENEEAFCLSSLGKVLFS